MYLTREEIRAKAKRKTVVVEGIQLQSLTEAEMSTLRGIWANRSTGRPEGEQPTHEELSRARRELVALSIVGDDGKRIYTTDDADLAEISEFDSWLFDKLYDAATDLSDRKSEVDAQEKKSESTGD